MKANWLKSSGFPNLKSGVVRCIVVVLCHVWQGMFWLGVVLYSVVWNTMRTNQLKSGGSLNSKVVS